ncbi:MAG TPA: hypothetical protein VFJ19_03010 [Nocardioidaceae bacterium]|nr:hypothetical protein [Nocardioidaceae bacterium]
MSTVPFRLSSALRAAGAGAAASLPAGLSSRRVVFAALCGGSYAASRRIDTGGIQVVSLTLDDNSSTWERVGAEALPTGSWVLANLLAAFVVRRLPVPRPLGGAALAGLVYLADTTLADKIELAAQRTRAAAEAGAEG